MTEMKNSVEHAHFGGEEQSALTLTLTGGKINSMWGAPTTTQKFQVEMDEGGWMHTYHAPIYAAPNGQRVQFRTSAVNNGPHKDTWQLSTSASDTQQTAQKK
jgi:hypothetical protein